eukprot:TRINITY_DN2028_c0_g1_i6.p1 TRINITY_DN2028_c0_g1~~TRINITY_DN2028_c0_g1_i6.p1  ORF type:complete len:1153 (+),score=205.45 TRINITY_DN2028_c0_g1_i6:439-3897(+)
MWMLTTMPNLSTRMRLNGSTNTTRPLSRTSSLEVSQDIPGVGTRVPGGARLRQPVCLCHEPAAAPSASAAVPQTLAADRSAAAPTVKNERLGDELAAAPSASAAVPQTPEDGGEDPIKEENPIPNDKSAEKQVAYDTRAARRASVRADVRTAAAETQDVDEWEDGEDDLFQDDKSGKAQQKRPLALLETPENDWNDGAWDDAAAPSASAEDGMVIPRKETSRRIENPRNIIPKPRAKNTEPEAKKRKAVRAVEAPSKGEALSFLDGLEYEREDTKFMRRSAKWWKQKGVQQKDDLVLECTCPPDAPGTDRRCECCFHQNPQNPYSMHLIPAAPQGSDARKRKRNATLDAKAEHATIGGNKRRQQLFGMLEQLEADEAAFAAQVDAASPEDAERLLSTIDIWKAGEPGESSPPARLPAQLCATLKPHQLGGLRFLWKNVVVSERRSRAATPPPADGDDDTAPIDMGCILAHSMGLGKTAQIVIFVHLLFAERVARTALILAPKSTMSNWKAEFARWGPMAGTTPVLFHSFALDGTFNDKNRVMKKWHAEGGVLCIGYEQYGRLSGAYEGGIHAEDAAGKMLRDPGPDAVFCDEGHIMRNANAAISRALMRIKTRRRVILTGTPLQNHLMEYWTMINFIRPGYFARAEFQKFFQTAIERGQRHDATEWDVNRMKARSYILHKELEPFLQRKDQTILQQDLPPKHEFIIYCPMSDLQKRVYGDLHGAYSRGYSTFHEGGRNILFYTAFTNKLAGHPDLLREHLLERKKDTTSGGSTLPGSYEWANATLLALNYRSGVLTDSPKLLAMLYITESCMKRGEKLLVFSQYTQTLTFLQAQIGKLTKGKNSYRLDGRSTDRARASSLEGFQKQRGFAIFYISTRAGGAGINLNTAHKAVLYDVSFNPALDQQALFRLYRYGQKSPVEIYRLVADGTPEAKVFASCISKDWLAKKLIDNNVPSRANVRGLGLDGVFAGLDTILEEEDEGPEAKEAKEAKLAIEKQKCLETSPLVKHVHDQLWRRNLKVAQIFRYESLLLDDETEKAGESESMAYKSYKQNGGCFNASEEYNPQLDWEPQMLADVASGLGMNGAVVEDWVNVLCNEELDVTSAKKQKKDPLSEAHNAMNNQINFMESKEATKSRRGQPQGFTMTGSSAFKL